MKALKYPLIFIMWHDAESTNEWEEPEMVESWVKKSSIINEVGWLIHEDDKSIAICSQMADDDIMGNRTRIPKGWIIRKYKLNISYGRKLK